MTNDYEIEYETKDGICLTLCFTAEFEAEDHGIGPYEYWGAKCRDIQWVNVCQGIEDIVALNEDGEDIFDSLPDSEKKRIESWAEEYANENAPDCD